MRHARRHLGLSRQRPGSWDLGYVYGLAIARTKGKSKPDTSAFVHFYRADDAGKWWMMADWEVAFPKK